MLRRFGLLLVVSMIAIGCGRGEYDEKLDSAIRRAKNPEAAAPEEPAEGEAAPAEGEAAPGDAGAEAAPAN